MTATILVTPPYWVYNPRMPDTKGRIQKGERLSPSTEFRTGQHWRERKPFWEKAWLEAEYITKQRSAGDIGTDFGLGASAIHFWLKKHGIPTRSTAEARSVKHWGASGESNPMYGKRGPAVPSWKGGVTPARQYLYGRPVWKKVAKKVWERDRGRCQSCGTTKQSIKGIHIHHVVPFANVELRVELSNLILLCPKCHRKEHPPWNKGKGGASSGDARSSGQQEPVDS